MSYETVRRWVNHFGPMIAAHLRKRRLKPHTTWHLDEVYLKIDGRTVYLWRAVDAEGEVLDVLVQSKRNTPAALKLMRKLLKKYAFVPERLVTDDLRSYGAAARDLGIESRHEHRAMEEQSGREFASINSTTGACDATIQGGRLVKGRAPAHDDFAAAMRIVIASSNSLVLRREDREGGGRGRAPRPA